MRRTGRTRIAAILLLALLLGVVEPLWAGCAACTAATASQRMGCHGGRVPEILPACCGGSVMEFAGSCGGRFEASPRTALPAPAASTASAGTLPPPTTAPAILVRQGDAAPVRLAGALQILHEGVGLYTLHSAFLI